MTLQRKAKRKLSNISFDSEGSHIALVSTKQGGPANGTTLAILKNKNLSDEFLAKASQVKVTMPIEEFLSRFFGMYQEQAEVLARAMGYKTVQMDMAELQAQEEELDMKEEMIDPEMPEEPEGSEYEDWIKSQLEAFEIMKSMQESEELVEDLMKMHEDDYLAILQDQARIEKAFRKIARAEKAAGLSKESIDAKSVNKSKAVATAAEEDTTSIASEVSKEVEPSEVSKSNKETPMTDMQEVQKEQNVEMVEKAQFESIMKAHEEMKVELQKAQDLINQFQAEKKEAILKSRKSSLDAAVKHAARSEVIFKAIKECSDEDFNAVVSTLAEIQEVVEKSALFEEQGASVQDEAPVIQESAVAKLLKAKQKQ